MNAAIIRNAVVYAPEPLGRANIVIINDKIAAIGPHAELPDWASPAVEEIGRAHV